jgi:hypothetical protein
VVITSTWTAGRPEWYATQHLKGMQRDSRIPVTGERVEGLDEHRSVVSISLHQEGAEAITL